MKILFIGDIVGSPGREAIKVLLPALREEFALDFVIANVENAAGGSGITPKVSEELFSFGIDAFTSGDHIFKRKEALLLVNQEPRLLRPANFPPTTPGQGAGLFKTKQGTAIFLSASTDNFKSLGRRA